MTTQTNLPTKTQIDGLIATCLKAGLNEAAGLLTLASGEISKYVRENTEEPMCVCLEVIGDNGDCPVHGKGFESETGQYCEDCDNTGYKRISPTILASCNHGAFSESDIKADYQERNDIRSMAGGC